MMLTGITCTLLLTPASFHLTEEELQVAVPEIELSSRETTITEGILSFPSMAFLMKHVDVVLTPAWMTLCRDNHY